MSLHFYKQEALKNELQLIMGTSSACDNSNEQRNNNEACNLLQDNNNNDSKAKVEIENDVEKVIDTNSSNSTTSTRPSSPGLMEATTSNSLGNCSVVESFYADAIVLVTGATGFLGKALLEKLLRSCARLTTIFVLIRPKRGKNVEQRFAELIENPVSISLQYFSWVSIPNQYNIKQKLWGINFYFYVNDSTLTRVIEK